MPDDLPDIDLTDWEYILVNPNNPLDSEFVPDITSLENGNFFDSRAADALQQMIDDARSEGFSVYLQSSYRNYAVQMYLFNGKVSQKQDSGLSYEEAVEAQKKSSQIRNKRTPDRTPADIVDKSINI
jgi:D-alanyl-D-alanine carboxypeptidase